MYRYVIIEDEPIIRKGTIKKLEPLSTFISCAGECSNGKEGIDFIERNVPDFVITDMQMPIMGGMDLLPYLAEHYPELPIIVISGYQNFDYMRQAIHSNAVDYIMKPFSAEDIQKTVQNVIDNLQNKQLSAHHLSALQEENELVYQNLDKRSLENLIMGDDTAPLKTNSEKYSFINHINSYTLYVLYLSQGEETAADPAILQKRLDLAGYQKSVLAIPCTSLSQVWFVLQLSYEDLRQNESAVKLLLSELILWREEEHMNIRIGLSAVHNKLSELNTAATEAANALDSQEITKANEPCYFHALERRPVDISWEAEAEFLFRVEAGMEKEVLQLLDQLFAFYPTIPECSLIDIKRHCEHLSARCQEILNYYLKTQKDNTSQQYSISMRNIVGTMFSVEDVKDYYQQFFLNITKLLREKSVYLQNELIDRIKIYIERNYRENLTEEFIASLFYLNRSYLSQLFYKKTGKKFIDYLTDIRIEKSKELLKTTDLQMYNIAKSVGYENAKYFYRIFRKKTGLTPKQYRLSP